MTRAIEAVVFVFLLFEGAKFTSVGTVRKSICNEDAKKHLPQPKSLARVTNPTDGMAEVTQAIESSFEITSISSLKVPDSQGGIPKKLIKPIQENEAEIECGLKRSKEEFPYP